MRLEGGEADVEVEALKLETDGEARADGVEVDVAEVGTAEMASTMPVMMGMPFLWTAERSTDRRSSIATVSVRYVY
jgi:hypothetical protein